MLTGWSLAGASLDRSEERGEKTGAEAEEAAAVIVADCRRCWEYFFAVVVALGLAWLDDAAKSGIRDGITALRAERRSIVKGVVKNAARSCRRGERASERGATQMK